MAAKIILLSRLAEILKTTTSNLKPLLDLKPITPESTAITEDEIKVKLKDRFDPALVMLALDETHTPE